MPLPFYMLSIAYSGVPDFPARLVAVLVLQRALWTAASSGVRRIRGTAAYFLLRLAAEPDYAKTAVVFAA